MNTEGFAYRAWRLGLRSDFVLTLFGKPHQERVIQGWWSHLTLRRLAVSK